MKDFFKDYNNSSPWKQTTRTHIGNYTVDKEKKTITFTLFDGSVHELEYTKENVERIQKLQEIQFDNMHRVVEERILDPDNKTLSASAEVFAPLLLAMNFVLQKNNTIFGIGSFLTIIYILRGGIIIGKTPLSEKMKLVKTKKELRLVSYLKTNAQAATEIIREEIEKERKPSNCQNLVVSYSPYTKELYEQGLNLNTIDGLSIAQQEQLKNKVKNKLRGKKICIKINHQSINQERNNYHHGL